MTAETDEDLPAGGEAGAAGTSKPAAAKPKVAREQPARDLPAPEQIAAWIGGEDLPTLGHLFDQLNLVRFDALTMQVRKEELLPQHWQVIGQRELPAGAVFAELGEVRRLRSRYSDGARQKLRLAALEVGWRELGGKQPALWTVADLFAVLRRVIDQRLQVDFHDLLSAVRDVWDALTVPHGRTQLELLWAVLLFVRQKTKK